MQNLNLLWVFVFWFGAKMWMAESHAMAVKGREGPLLSGEGASDGTHGMQSRIKTPLQLILLSRLPPPSNPGDLMGQVCQDLNLQNILLSVKT